MCFPLVYIIVQYRVRYMVIKYIIFLYCVKWFLTQYLHINFNVKIHIYSLIIYFVSLKAYILYVFVWFFLKCHSFTYYFINCKTQGSIHKYHWILGNVVTEMSLRFRNSGILSQIRNSGTLCSTRSQY